MLKTALRWTLIAFVVLALLSMLALWSWGRFAARAQGAPTTALAVAPAATALDRLVQPLLSRQPPDASGAAMLGEGVAAFVARAQAARVAERSLDVQYYIWRHDLTGRLLEHELMAAAERGVRVRLLIDDMSVAGRDDALLAMDAHPNLEVRLFNPARNRASAVRRALEMGLRFAGFNRRMHNKAWIADNRVAIVGGRNVGDEYFDAADTNFHDADLLLLGPAVAQTSDVFDAFWNSAAVVPLRALHQGGSRWSADEFSARRAQWWVDAKASPWVQALAGRDDLAEKLAPGGGLTVHWSPSIRVLSDPPEKASPLAHRQDRAGWLLYDVMALLFSAQRDSWLISPYFVPGEGGTLLLAGQARRGVQVRVLTNSLAANDVVAVHGGYAGYRKPLLEAGVELFELMPHGQSNSSLFGSSGASLHTKAFAVDGETGFIGSFNMDPRSVSLNTEMGVVFQDREVTAELLKSYASKTAAANSYRVALEQGALRWQDGSVEPPKVWTHEPETSWWRRATARVIGWLPVESQL